MKQIKMESIMTEYTFKVYNNRRNSELTYRVKKSEKGWYISHIAINGDCEPDGTPYFYTNFDQDYIKYPSGFGSFLKHLWELLEDEIIDNEAAQEKMQQLADWVTVCEKSQPRWKGWNC